MFMQQDAFHWTGGVEKYRFTPRRAPLVPCRWQGEPLCGILGGGGMGLELGGRELGGLSAGVAAARWALLVVSVRRQYVSHAYVVATAISAQYWRSHLAYLPGFLQASYVRCC
jgi:hypothetical protein